MGQELTDTLPLLFGRGRLEGKFDGLGVALVSREPELQTIEINLAIMPLIHPNGHVEETRPVSQCSWVAAEPTVAGDPKIHGHSMRQLQASIIVAFIAQSTEPSLASACA